MAQNIKPRYEVHELEGTRMKTIASVRKEGGFDYEEVEVPAGYMVYFPSGSSIRLSEAELKEQGFDKPAALIDMDSGDEVGMVQHGALKAKADQVIARGRRKGSQQKASGE
jgi:hypothetical protein|tara:strand:- start:317 stop:649 length:333 start_codon:yes stop_codon:yes gene_type:complete